MMRGIRWLRLELERFGVWRTATRFRFPPGLGLLTLPNEGGKSTMVAGLRAVLFGLPGRSDPRERGIARYQAWGTSGGCRGTLELQIDERTIRIQRDFHSHDTIVDEVDAAGRSVTSIFSGNANPEGRTSPPLEYREILRRFLDDLADERLFAATFLVEQPVLPAGETGEALRRLVSGVGRVGGDQALESLFEEIKSLTRATGDLGLVAPRSTRPTNQRTDGAIEEGEQRLEALEAIRAETDSCVRELRDLEEAAERAAAAERDAAEGLAHAQADRDRIEEYRRFVEERERAREAHDDLQRVLAAHDQKASGARADRDRITGEFEDLIDEPERLEEAIEEALQREARHRSIVDAVSSERETAADLSSRLDLLRSIPPLRDPAIAGSDPVGWIARARETAKQWRDAVGTFLDADRRLSESISQRSRVAAVAVLPTDLLEAVARLEQSLTELRNRESMAADLAQAHGKRLDDFERRSVEFSERFGSLEGVEEGEVVPLLKERSARHRRVGELLSDARRMREGGIAPPRRRWTRGLLIGLPVGVVCGGFLLTFRLHPGFAVAAFLFLLIVALLGLSSPGTAEREGWERLTGFEREAGTLLRDLREREIPTGPWLPDDEGILDRARDLFRRRDEAAALLAEAQRELPHPETIEQVEQARAESRSQVELLERQARAIEEATGLPAGQAVREYRRLCANLEEIGAQRQRAWRRIFGADDPSYPSSDEPSDPLGRPLRELAEPWEPIVKLAGLLEWNEVTVRGLHDRLEATTSDTWDGWESAARGHVQFRTNLAQVTSNLEKGEGELRTAEERLQEARRGIGEARLAASGGSIATLRDRFRAYTELSNRAERAEREAMDLLETARGGPFAERERLARSLAEQDERRRDRQILIDRAMEESDLVRTYAATDPREQDRFRRELEAMVAAAAAASLDTQRKAGAARAALEAFRPPRTANIAALDLEIGGRRREIAVLRGRCDAATRAWFALSEAIAEFSSSHREELESHVDERFRTITGRDARTVRLGTDFEVSLIEDGVSSSDIQLSQGAMDQLAFCLRLALADLVAGELVLPLILDDPFVHSDRERLERIRAALERSAEERQIILLTQDERQAGWGGRIEVEPV